MATQKKRVAKKDVFDEGTYDRVSCTGPDYNADAVKKESAAYKAALSVAKYRINAKKREREWAVATTWSALFDLIVLAREKGEKRLHLFAHEANELLDTKIAKDHDVAWNDLEKVGKARGFIIEHQLLYRGHSYEVNVYWD